VNYGSSTGALQVSGSAPLATYQALLRSVALSSNSGNKLALHAPRTIRWAITDADSDGAGARSATGTTTLQGGSAIDGYLAGATVFADINNDGTRNWTDADGDGSWDPNEGEPWTLTDSQGFYSFNTDVAGLTLVSMGGIDTSTNQAFSAVLRTAPGATVITPLTSLVLTLTETRIAAQGGTAPSGDALNSLVNAAMADVRNTLGLSAGTDLNRYDPIAVLNDSQASAAERSAALGAQKAAAQVVNLLISAQQAGGAAAASTALSNLAQRIASTPTQALNLSDANTLAALLPSSTTTSAEARAAQIARLQVLNTSVTTANSIEAVYGAQALAQGDFTAPNPPQILQVQDNVLPSLGSISSGSSSNDTTPTLTISAEPGSTVRLYDGNTLLGTASETSTAGSFTFTPSSPLTAGAHSLTARATDAAGNTSGASTAFTITLVNDAPTFGAIPTSTYRENGAALPLAPALSLSDADATQISRASVVISAGFSSGDTLSWTPETGINATYDSSSGKLALQGIAPLARYESLLRSLAFSSSSEDPGNPNAMRTITWSISDTGEAGASGATAVVNSSLQVVSINDAPQVMRPLVSAAKEGSAIYSVDLLAGASDPDPGDTAALKIRDFSSSSEALSLSSDGRSVRIDPGHSSLDRLAQGEQAVLTATYAIEDPQGGRVAQSLAVTISGSNDQPVIGSGSLRTSITELNEGNPAENNFTHIRTGTISFTDPDNNDSHTVKAVAEASNYLGRFVPSIVPASASSGASVVWTFSVADADLDSLDAGQVITQTYRLTLSDTAGASDSRLVTVTLVGSSDVPVAARFEGRQGEALNAPLPSGMFTSQAGNGGLPCLPGCRSTAPPAASAGCPPPPPSATRPWRWWPAIPQGGAPWAT